MTEQHWQVDTVYDDADGLDYALMGQCDAMILDVILLPKLDGFEVAKRLRAAHISPPILTITVRDEVPDKINDLDCGADDHMTKPCDSRELPARIRAFTRCQGEVIGNTVTVGHLTLRLDVRCLMCWDNSVRLGFKEFEIMRLLITNYRSVVPKDDIISKVWGLESDAEDNNVEVYISFLRKKIALLQSNVSIGTVRKVGYFWGAGKVSYKSCDEDFFHKYAPSKYRAFGSFLHSDPFLLPAGAGGTLHGTGPDAGVDLRFPPSQLCL